METSWIAFNASWSPLAPAAFVLRKGLFASNPSIEKLLATDGNPLTSTFPGPPLVGDAVFINAPGVRLTTYERSLPGFGISASCVAFSVVDVLGLLGSMRGARSAMTSTFADTEPT